MTGERVLIADDEPDVLDVARLALELAGYQVATANNGGEAVEAARQGAFDLLLTDVKMPFMDGLDAFQEMRRLDPEMVGVVMTGYGTLSIAIQAIKNGFVDFIIKPFTPDELTDAVGRALENERLRRENTRLKALIPLFELSRHFVSEISLATLLARVVRTGRKETRAARATLLLLGEDGRFHEGAHVGEPPGDSEPWHRLAEQVASSCQPLVVDRSASGGAAGAIMPNGGSLLALPLRSKERVLGVLFLDKQRGAEPFTEGDAELLNVLAGQAAVAIDNARLFEEREAAYRELAQMDHMKSEFINIAAHELRTPLSLVLGYAGLLEEEESEQVQEYASSISQNALRLRAIVEDMTNLRYLEMNQAQLHLQWIDLVEVVQQAEAAERLTLGDKQVVLHLETADELGHVRADRKKVELIFNNLLSNAFKFSPPNSTVTVEIEEVGDNILVAVRDQGAGIPLAEQAKIWRRFYQVEASLTRTYGGLGLGLAIVKGMVELHRGRVWVESVEGEGSTFYFTIPKNGPSS